MDKKLKPVDTLSFPRDNGVIYGHLTIGWHQTPPPVIPVEQTDEERWDNFYFIFLYLFYSRKSSQNEKKKLRPVKIMVVWAEVDQ